MNENATNLFVYGTLRPDGWNHRLIEPYVHHAVPASTRGILVSLGTIPALIPGDGIVKGVILEVDPAALIVTDRLEGVPHLYRRVEITVTLDDGRAVEAWAYQYAEAERIADRPRLLLHWEDGVPVFAWPPL